MATFTEGGHHPCGYGRLLQFHSGGHTDSSAWSEVTFGVPGLCTRSWAAHPRHDCATLSQLNWDRAHDFMSALH